MANYFITEIMRILTLPDIDNDDIKSQSIDDVLDILNSAIDINNVLRSTVILDNIVNNINNSSNNINIQYKSSNDLHYRILQKGIVKYLYNKYENINDELQNLCQSFTTNDDVYNILEQVFKNIENVILSEINDEDKEYTDEQLENISKFDIDNLQDEFNNDLDIMDIIQSACVEADFLYSNINKSYSNLAILILGSIINKYHENNGKINDYNQFLNFLYDNFINLEKSDFILCRRFIINRDFNHIDPIVEYVINTYINSEFPEDRFQECNLRETGAKRIDEVLNQSDFNYLDDCIQYILNQSQSNDNNFIDKYLNIFFKKQPSYIVDNIPQQSFADFLKNKSVIKSESEPESDIKQIDLADIQSNTNKQVDIKNPNTWDIKTFIDQLGSPVVMKIIDDNIKKDQLFFPTVRVNNNDCFKKFIDTVRTDICKALKQDSKFNSIKTKEDLIKIISDKIENLNGQYIINTRNIILNTYNDGNDPKLDAIISNLNNELKKKLNIKNDYLVYPKPLYSIVLQYLKNPRYIENIRRVFIDKFKNNSIYKERILYSSNKQNNIQNIHYTYLKFFPLILIDDLYSKDIKTLSYIFSENTLNQVIEDNLQNTEVLFLPKNNKYYRDFTQILIQLLLHNLGTISRKDNNDKRELREIFAILRQRYNNLLESEYNGYDLNSMANKTRSIFFESYKNIQDPLILNIITQLFPDLDSIDIDTQSTLAKSLSKYILETNGNKFTWDNLKPYFEKITESVFHTNYDTDNLNSACYNTVT